MHGALVLCKVIQNESTTGLNPAVQFGRAMHFYLTDTAAEIGGETMIQFVIGAFVGAAVVVFIMALICAAGDEEEREE